jgi:hypothetical protein
MLVQWANGTVLAETTIDPGGAFSTTFTVPNEGQGAYPVTFTDVDSRYFLVAYFTVSEPGCQDSCVIAGRVRTSDGGALGGVAISTSQEQTSTAADGTFLLTDQADGTYTVTPSMAEWSFTPQSRKVTVPPNAEGLEFTATALPSSGDLFLPFPSGETWYVCQGYNGSISHKGIPALDLTVRSQDVGRNGCYGEVNASAGRTVTAPGSGKATLSGVDGTCLNLSSGLSMWIGHMVERVTGEVAPGAALGKTATANRGPNGGYAHIHIQVHPGAGCSKSGAPIAFDHANGTRFIGASNLPYSGEVNQYRGLPLRNP